MLRLSAVVAILLICAPSYGDDAAKRKTYDERKAERLAKQRAERRACEARTEPCLAACRRAERFAPCMEVCRGLCAPEGEASHAPPIASARYAKEDT